MRAFLVSSIALALLTLMSATLSAADESVTTATATFQHFRRIRISISTRAELSGQLVSIHDQAGIELGVGRLIAGNHNATAIVMIPMSAPGMPYHDLSCTIPGQPPVKVDIPNADSARRLAFAETPIQFRQAVFSGTKFPSYDFREPNLVEDLVGPYTLSATFYDAEFNETNAPAKPGRYGAIIVAHGADGSVTQRFLSLYHIDGDAHWRDVKFDMAGLSFPSSLAIDPAVLSEYGSEVGDFLKSRLSGGGEDGPSAAILLAWMHEEKSGSGKVSFRSGPAECDARWWFALKKRLGLVQHRYLSFLPKGYESGNGTYPLILFLHGSGERGIDVEDVRKHGPHKYLLNHDNPFVIIEPQCDPGQWWHACSVIDLLDEICSKYRVDKDRLYLTGLSMGGFGAWATAGEFPNRFAAVVPICGRGDTSEAVFMKDLPIWAFHGAKDPVVPVTDTKDMVNALTAVGGRVVMTIIPDAQHDSWTEAYNTPALYDWLLKQRLGKPDQSPANAR